MESHRQIISTLVENFPHPATFKAADTGKYLGSNAANSLEFGMSDPLDLVGLTIHDLSFTRRPWGAQYANRIAELDGRVREEKIGVKDRCPFLNHNGEVRYYETIKFPMLDSQENMVGIVTYAHDIQQTLCYPEQYRLYRRFYDKPDAIKNLLVHFGLHASFPVLPTEAQLLVLLEKAEGYTHKQIAKRLQLSLRRVERHVDEIRAIINGSDLDKALSLLKRATARCES